MTVETLPPIVDAPEAPPALGRPAPWLSGFARVVAAGTFCVVAAGSAVTSTRSGLADRHWPTFSGELLPSLAEMRADRGLLFEHGHRLLAGTVLALTWVLAFLLWRTGGRRRWVAGLSFGAAALGLVPAALGGLTVLLQLPPQVSIAHVSAAMGFLGLNTAVAAVCGRRWFDAGADLEKAGGLSGEDASWLAAGALFLCPAIYVQAVLGAFPRHLHAGEIPHILWAFAVFTGVVLVAGRILGRHSRLPGALGPAMTLLLLVVLQFFLGFTAYIARPDLAKAPGSGLFELTASAHQAGGALMLAVSVLLLLRILRLRRVSHGGGAIPPAARGGA